MDSADLEAHQKALEAGEQKQAPEPGKNWQRNRKKKQRQKLSKKFKAAAFQAPEGAASDFVYSEGPPEQAPSAAKEGGEEAASVPPSKRARLAAGPAAAAAPPASQAAPGQKLSVSTFPVGDRAAQPPSPGVAPSQALHPAALVPEQAVAEAAVTSAAAAAQADSQPALPSSQPPEAPEMAVHHARIDLSQAATLIHAELRGSGAGAGAGSAALFAGGKGQLQLPAFSPASSGCHGGQQGGVRGGCSGPGGSPPPPGAAAGGIAAPAAAPLSSLVVSVATSGAAAGGAAADAAGPLFAGRRAAGGVLDSDGEGEDWGEAGEGEDYGPAADGFALTAAGAAAEVVGTGGGGGGKGGPVRRRKVYVYGNYHRYYGYRLGQAFGEDPRLQCFERGWFSNRRCLDVGCNEGIVTLAIVMKYGCKSMMGVDIDEHLIRKACTHLREQRSAAVGRLVQVRRGGTAPEDRRAARAAHGALARTWFVHADFVSSEGTPGSFDTITCLSVIKWVHLNQGDEGLEALLAKFWRLLAPGGLLLLEPQPWRSYKAAAGKMRKQPVAPSTYFHRLDELKLRPETLPDLLVDRLGFRLVKRLAAPSSSAAGFDRPMLLFRKPA